MNDNERTALAVPSGGRMVGPTERERCFSHRSRWVLYRWEWDKDSTVEDGHPEIVRGCGACKEEECTYDR